MLKPITSICWFLLIAIAGAFLAWTQAGRNVEEEIGLTWLFVLRGAKPPPPDVVIISLDQLSAEILHLPDNPDLWPRSFYASLIEKVNQQNPALIAFNIHFGQNREPVKDALLANAMSLQKNVILSNYLKQVSIPSTDGRQTIHFEHLIEPLEQFRLAALTSAPFPLPKNSTTVKEFWTYKESAGDMATLPVSIFQLYVLKKAYPEILQIFNRIDPALLADFPPAYDDLTKQAKTDTVMKVIQSYLLKRSDVLDEFEQILASSNFSSQATYLLRSWVALFRASKRLYLNYYGDVGAITTVPFYQVISADGKLNPNLFRNKIVLVGYGEDLEPEKQQGFYSAYSKASGQAICPIEIAATSLANILDRSWLKPLPTRANVLVIFAWGLILSGLHRFLVYRHAMALTIICLLAYCVFSVYQFQSQAIWLPLAIPAGQTLVLLLLESTKHYLKIKKLTAYYLPKEVFAIRTNYPETMHEYGNLLEGACMATDAGQYTSLSEIINPLDLNKLMNDYYAIIFPRVKKSGGLITDVIGDAMLAVWADKKNADTHRRNACSAALAIQAAVNEFNRGSPHFLATRIGLHYGPMRLGNVGAMEHYEFRAVGDIVNTSARIEGLNKILGTQVLASATVVEGLQGFHIRELGSFLLKGKTNPVQIYELMAYETEGELLSHYSTHFLAMFGEALAEFKEGNWEAALILFNEISRIYANDGPTVFYMEYLQNRLTSTTSDKSERSVVIDVGNIPTFLH